MKKIEPLKLFISYSHIDEKYITEFIKHISPLKTNGLIKEWYDRKILAGQDFQDTIDNNLDSADVICLFISANFISSTACMKEKIRSYNLVQEKGILVIPVILSPCAWTDDKDLKINLALPTDGMPVTKFSDINEGFLNVYNGLKKCIEFDMSIRKLEFTSSFQLFLKDSELLSKAHPKKTELELNDIFIYPELLKFDELKEFEKKTDSGKLIENMKECENILIAGESQSGKTTLCKIFCQELRKKNLIPVYIHEKQSTLEGKIDNIVKENAIRQYERIDFDIIPNNRIVPIIDDFHFAKKKEKIISDLSKYCYQILIVDDIFNLNFKDESITKNFNQYSIKQFTATKRNQLIEKWVLISEDKLASKNEYFKEIDISTEHVNIILGKLFTNGIMPSYPFFILSIISAVATFEKPLDQEITSQGYCYQSLIYLYLRKQGVKNDEIDTYINFLSEISYFFLENNSLEITNIEFEKFLNEYIKKFILTVDKEKLITNLCKTKILYLDNFNNYSFYYPYIYFFFVAKYLSEHINENQTTIERIINNLHKENNCYIAIFMSHHSKSSYLLDEIMLNVICQFDKFKPATLNSKEMDFFDKFLKNTIETINLTSLDTPEEERKKILLKQDKVEEIKADEEELKKSEDIANEATQNAVTKELRRSIKTVEVLGIIIKNRVGSIEKERLESVFEESMNQHLRLLSVFFDSIRDEKNQEDLIDYITTRITKMLDQKHGPNNSEKHHPIKDETIKKLAINIFWNLNYQVVFGIINKIIHSLGSEKLYEIVENVCTKINTPASNLVKHGISMWYNKSLNIDEIAYLIEKDDFSETSKKVMNNLIANHCCLHQFTYQEKQKIETKLKIPAKRLIQMELNKE